MRDRLSRCHCRKIIWRFQGHDENSQASSTNQAGLNAFACHILTFNGLGVALILTHEQYLASQAPISASFTPKLRHYSMTVLYLFLLHTLEFLNLRFNLPLSCRGHPFYSGDAMGIWTDTRGRRVELGLNCAQAQVHALRTPDETCQTIELGTDLFSLFLPSRPSAAFSINLLLIFCSTTPHSNKTS